MGRDRSSKIRSLPVPFLKQVRDRKLEAWQDVLAFEHAAGTNKLAVGGRMANVDTLLIRVNHPSQPGATGEEILESFVDLGAGIVFRQDFDCQIGRTGEEPRFIGFESEGGEPAP